MDVIGPGISSAPLGGTVSSNAPSGASEGVGLAGVGPVDGGAAGVGDVCALVPEPFLGLPLL
jgi:hypothetical protein